MEELIIPYSPRYPEAHEILERTRFCVLVAHRRFGKTVLVINHLIKSALLCRRGEGHFAYIAPLRNQAKSVAWKYLKAYTAPFSNRVINETELSIIIPSIGGGATLRLFGADNPDALRGLYFDGVVLDEVAQMKPQVWEEIIQPALADREGFAVFIGTPKGINLFSELYYSALEKESQGDPDWRAMRYTINESNALPSSEVERLRAEMSENSFRQEMLCDFSAASDNILISLDEVDEASRRKIPPEEFMAWPMIVGVDVARFGADSTVFFARRGRFSYPPKIFSKMSNTDVARQLAAYIAEHKPAYVNIDQGQGTGVIDFARELCQYQRTCINEVPFGGRATDPRYANRRAEMWMKMREWLRSGGALPADPGVREILRAELTAPSYSFDNTGRIKLEPKEDIRERLNRSTDLGDALALTFAVEASADMEAFLDPLARQYRGEARRAAVDWLSGREKKGLYDPYSGL